VLRALGEKCSDLTKNGARALTGSHDDPRYLTSLVAFSLLINLIPTVTGLNRHPRNRNSRRAFSGRLRSVSTPGFGIVGATSPTARHGEGKFGGAGLRSRAR
jgi:hypothetical protein